MVIREMTRQECLQVLAESRLARLACSNENQPYVVPVYLSYYEATGCLYGFTTLGQKVDWMRANPLVCVEVDEMTDHDNWVSVIAMGRFEELEQIPGGNVASPRTLERPHHVDEAMSARSVDSRHQNKDDEREMAWQVLQSHPEWWEPGCSAWAARVHRDSAEPYTPIYYKILIDQVTGHQATRDPRETIAIELPTERPCWLCGALSRVFGRTTSQSR